jgi:hypothetical protein
MSYNASMASEEEGLPSGEEGGVESLPGEEQDLAAPLEDRSAALAARARELAATAQSATEGSLYSVGGLLESPNEEANGDDLSDLFESPTVDDPEMRIDDLVSVDDDDLFGGDEDMSDLLEVDPEDVEVTEEDVMGEDFDDILDPFPRREKASLATLPRRPPTVRRPVQPGGLGGVMI